MRWTLPAALALAMLFCGQLSVAQVRDEPAGAAAPEPAQARQTNGTTIRRTVVPVQDVDNPGRGPFHHSFELRFGAAPGAESVFAVPRRKHLVIDAVSIQAHSAAAAEISCAITTSADGETASLFIALRNVLPLSPTGRVYTASQEVRAYADAGSDVATICRQAGAAAAEASAQVSIIGHLVGR